MIFRAFITGMLMTLLLSPVPQALAGQVLTATGYGDQQSAAREEALAALASSIFVRIESTSEVYQSDRGDNFFTANTLSTTQLPLIGVNTECESSRHGYVCEASMRTDRALPLYRQAAADAEERISAQLRRGEGLGGMERYRALAEALTAFDQLDKYRTVIGYLSGDPWRGSALPMSAAELRAELAALRERAVSIEIAVSALLDDLRDSGISPQPPLPEESREVTPFGQAVLNELERQLGSRLDHVSPQYQLVGRYRHSDSGMELSYSLVDDAGNNRRTSLVRLAPEAYADYRVEPSMVDFDRLLHSGYAVSDDFQVQVSSNRGSRGLAFEAGSTVVLMVRLSRPGYFYVVGHTHSDDGEKSYLLDLHSAPGARRFVRYVNADEANRWLSLGEFVVQPPFGTESLQVVASEEDLAHQLPDYRYDQSSGYYIVANELSEGVEAVRLRSLQRRRETGSESAEAVLMFTTSGAEQAAR